MSHRPWSRVSGALVAALLGPAVVITALTTSTGIAHAATVDPTATKALDSPYIRSAELIGDAKGVGVLTKPLYGLPKQGTTALVLSTGDASLVADPAAADKLPKTKRGDLVGTDLKGAGSADKNDLTQIKLTLDPPYGDNGCVRFDFMFFSEEYPNYTGARFNDIFTAELNRSEFSLKGNQLVAPNNFAYSEDKEVLSVNTFSKFSAAPASGLNGRSGLYSAATKVEWPDAEQNPVTLYLSVQDLGDSKLDSAVVIDNLRFDQAADCDQGVVPIVDTDGDGLSDDWETSGIDYDGDGKADLDLKAMGADPKHKDIFLEIDWMYEDPKCTTTDLACVKAQTHDKTPQPAALAKVVDAFAAAPVSNPDGKSGVTVHIDAGPNSIMDPRTQKTWGSLSKANKLPFAAQLGVETSGRYDWSDFDAIKAKNFDPTRADAFHYTVYGHQHAPNGSSGRSRGLPASDLILTDQDFGNGRFTALQEAGTLMHELGHNLRLFHGGDKGEPNPRTGYYSVMNYDYQTKGVDLKGKIDYSRGDVNYGPSGSTLFPYNDWDHLVFTGGSIGSLGQNGPLPDKTASEELTKDEAVELDALAVDGDGVVALIGPTLVAKGIDQQVLIADVTNVSKKDSTYKVVLQAPFGTAQEVTITVPAEKTGRIEIPIKVDQAQTGDVTATLYNADTVLSTSNLTVNAVDLSDPETEQKVEQTIQEIKQDPPAGLDPEVIKKLDTTMTAKAPAPQQTATNAGDFPIGIVVAIAAGVLVVVVAIVLVARRRKTA